MQVTEYLENIGKSSTGLDRLRHDAWLPRQAALGG
jgi:hypothetical protein